MFDSLYIKEKQNVIWALATCAPTSLSWGRKVLGRVSEHSHVSAISIAGHSATGSQLSNVSKTTKQLRPARKWGKTQLLQVPCWEEIKTAGCHRHPKDKAFTSLPSLLPREGHWLSSGTSNLAHCCRTKIPGGSTLAPGRDN